MPLFTFVLEYKGGTYIKQASGRDAKVALGKVVDQFEILTAKARQKFIEGARDEGLVAVDSTKGVWCACTLARGNLVLMHIVATIK